jgi:hypothetical protein
MVKKLADVHPAELTHDQWITYSDLLFDVTGTADADRYFWFVTPVTPYPSPLRVLTTPFESVSIQDRDGRRDCRRAESGSDRDRRLRGEAARANAAGIVLPADEISSSCRSCARSSSSRRGRVQRRGVEGGRASR